MREKIAPGICSTIRTSLRLLGDPSLDRGNVSHATLLTKLLGAESNILGLEIAEELRIGGITGCVAI